MGRIKSWMIIPVLFAILMPIYVWFLLNCNLVIISGSSMEPVLFSDYIAVAFKDCDIAIGNIYILSEPGEGLTVIKRLVGMPGDIIELKDGATYRNGDLLMEASDGSWDNATYELGSGEYLFMGDNRKESYDGRHWSRFSHLDEIKAEVRYVIYPISFFGDLRWDANARRSA